MKALDPRILGLAEAILAFVEMLAPATPPAPPPRAYVSNRRGPHPAGKSARWCRDNFRHIPGSRKEGRDWVVAVADYERWATSLSAARAMPSPVVSSADLDSTPERSTNNKAPAWSARFALQAAGVRSSTDGRR